MRLPIKTCICVFEHKRKHVRNETAEDQNYENSFNIFSNLKMDHDDEHDLSSNFKEDFEKENVVAI